MLRNIFATLFAAVFSFSAFASVSDTITVRHYTISIDTINYATQNIRGSAALTVMSRLNSVTNITLNFLELNIDSIVSNGQPLTYSYNDTLIRITPPATLNQNDSIDMTVYYNGHPQQDASWGGFYFSGQYAFNLGVSFLEDPHPFGRVWFPCIDEFTDRSLYDFYITTDTGYKAFCNGTLQGSTANPNGTITWHWKINQTIPSYLASMAVAPFYTLQRTSNGIPVQWAVLVTDTVATLNTFTNIDTAVSLFITAYGPYRWDKIGYVTTPVVYGGMEHATSIHVSKAFIDGTLNYETLWAHELSHMWWGDNVTCASEQEMWLNEGMASFNEYFFTQKVYGLTAYKNAIRTNHRKVLQFAHIIDGNYFALNNVPHAYTYGNTVYHKGADFAHTLRNYMSDSLFFIGCHGYMSNRAYGNATSAQFRDELTLASGVNMTRFFDDWIFTPGFPHFSIDSVVHVSASLDHYWVYTRQKTKGNLNHLYSMPVDITFSNGVNDTTVTVVIDSATNVFHIALNGAFDFIAMDRSEKISDAISDYEKAITAAGSIAFPETNVTLIVQAVGTSSPFVRIEHNWVKPDDFVLSNPGIRLSDYHYWKVDGRFDSTFISAANFVYDGRTPAVSSTLNSGYIDNTLITATEDSLVLLYRTKAGENWSIIPNTTTNFVGSHTDKSGNIRVDTLRKGEYVLGYRDYTATTIPALSSPVNLFTLKAFPNPASGICRLEFALPYGESGTISVFDSAGKNVYRTDVFSHQQFINWDTYACASGMYTATLTVKGSKVSEKIILIKK